MASKKTTSTGIRIPNELLARIDQAVAPTGAKNRNDLILEAVREYLEKLVKV